MSLGSLASSKQVKRLGQRSTRVANVFEGPFLLMLSPSARNPLGKGDSTGAHSLMVLWAVCWNCCSEALA